MSLYSFPPAGLCRRTSDRRRSSWRSTFSTELFSGDTHTDKSLIPTHPWIWILSTQRIPRRPRSQFIYTKNLCAAEIGFYLHREFRGCAGLLFKGLYIYILRKGTYLEKKKLSPLRGLNFSWMGNANVEFRCACRFFLRQEVRNQNKLNLFWMQFKN